MLLFELLTMDRKTRGPKALPVEGGTWSLWILDDLGVPDLRWTPEPNLLELPEESKRMDPSAAERV